MTRDEIAGRILSVVRRYVHPVASDHLTLV